MTIEQSTSQDREMLWPKSYGFTANPFAQCEAGQEADLPKYFFDHFHDAIKGTIAGPLLASMRSCRPTTRRYNAPLSARWSMIAPLSAADSISSLGNALKASGNVISAFGFDARHPRTWRGPRARTSNRDVCTCKFGSESAG